MTSPCSSSNCRIDWTRLGPCLLALGPNQTDSSNMLFSRLDTDNFPLCTAWGRKLGQDKLTPNCDFQDRVIDASDSNLKRSNTLPLISYGKALIRGFQMACKHGPLCAEPMYGVLFILEEIIAEQYYTLKLPEATSTNRNDTVPLPAPLLTTQSISETDVPNSPSKPTRHLNRSISWLDECNDDYNEDDDWDCKSNNSANVDYNSDESSLDEHDRDEFSPQATGHEEKLTIDSSKEFAYWKVCIDMDWLHDIPPALLTSAMTRACLIAFQACQSQRLMLTMYDVELQARSDVLGRMFGVLRRRYGRVIREDFRDGENIFVISARLPVIESFGLTADIRKRTSGHVNLPQLRPGGWEIFDVDPLQKENPEKHKMHNNLLHSSTAIGSKRNIANVALTNHNLPNEEYDDCDDLIDESTKQISRVQRYIRDIRQRKGLALNEQLVISADKQRTLKKNK